MPTIKETFDHAKHVWAVENLHFVIGEVREGLTRGEFGLKTDTGNLESRVDGRTLPNRDGFEWGTHVDYGIAWQLGFSKEDKIIHAGPGKVFRIPVSALKGTKPEGSFIFRKSIHQPAQTHAPREWLSEPYKKNEETIRKDAETKFQKAVEEGIPDRKVDL